MTQTVKIGKVAMLLASLDEEEKSLFSGSFENIKYCQGKAGSMDVQKVIAAVETAAKRNGIISEQVYRETHALYHAILESLQGVTRGHIGVGNMMRTVGLRFAVVRGRPYEREDEGEWIAVAFYGTIGAPVKGLEHETFGLGINHI
ncbi:hut operon positive regulatory protein [Halobacillus karajensis]|uniref:Hut operon positive regulatory protein n=1 Tax=Halobacillus karajensis TaxID=195088 RepID=A0A024P3G7_9BACI|nr:hut operon transcriptional regulator HutP [Halobacillus karajensis]CDQ18872.1 Hut operon positive regulatory protein [Halobacillus karajensis]CDQ23055.1 Hut operon positive regulatory protein [Halobacillus karajensis]CDQ26537.1 Hut operon positive regulatory protein [Halobacillus karajensis]SEH44954.1 hut operon positive regulatory protein [Halobacillus karajensis]